MIKGKSSRSAVLPKEYSQLWCPLRLQRCSLDHGYSSPIAPCLLKKAICFLLAALSSFLKRRPQAETCSSLTPSTTCVPNPDTIRGSKALFPLWGKLSKEEHRDPFPKAGRSLEGLSKVRNHLAQIHKKVKKKQNSRHLPISTNSGSSPGKRLHWLPNKQRLFVQGWREMRIFTSSWANLSTACKTHDYYGITCIYTWCLFLFLFKIYIFSRVGFRWKARIKNKKQNQDSVAAEHSKC